MRKKSMALSKAMRRAEVDETVFRVPRKRIIWIRAERNERGSRRR